MPVTRAQSRQLSVQPRAQSRSPSVNFRRRGGTDRATPPTLSIPIIAPVHKRKWQGGNLDLQRAQTHLTAPSTRSRSQSKRSSLAPTAVSTESRREAPRSERSNTQAPSDGPSNFLGYDLESLPPRSSISSRSLSYESLVPHNIPDLPDDVVIKYWSYLATGTHGQVRKIRVQHGDVEEDLCLKLFSERWEEEYHREVYAYAFMIHQKVKHCIPQVYWKGAFPISKWGGGERPPGDDELVNDWDGNSEASKQQSEEERIYYGIVMEYFDDFREVDYNKLDLQTAEAVARALCRVHEARILHGDIAERNVLLVRKFGIVRVVWIDYSCAWINAYGKALDNEWGGLMAEFYDNTDRHLFTDEVFARFETLRQARTQYDRKKAPEPQSDLTSKSIVFESSALRFAYTSFAFIQCILVLTLCHMRLRFDISELSFHTVVLEPSLTVSCVSSISLSILFFLLSNGKIETKFDRTLALVFVVHNIVLGSTLIREQFAWGGMGSAVGKASIIGAASCFVWALIVFLNLAQGNGNGLCFTET